MLNAQSVVGFVAESGIRKTINGESFGKYAQTVLTVEVNYRVLRTRKKERLRYEKINPDPYTKRTAGRVAATPALQKKPVDLASCATQAHARRPLEYLHLAVALTAPMPVRHSRRALRRIPLTPHLNLLSRPIAMSHPIQTYAELQQQIHDDLRIQHPEWVKPNGESPMCDSYETCLTKMLDTLTRRRSSESIVPPDGALEPAVTGS
jgi:hypothetical protein